MKSLSRIPIPGGGLAEVPTWSSSNGRTDITANRAATDETRLMLSDLLFECLFVVLHHLSSIFLILEAIHHLLLGLLSGLLLVSESFHLGGHRPFHIIVVISSFLTFNVEILQSSCPFSLRILLASVFPDFVLSGTAVSSAAANRRFDSVPVELPGPFPQIHSLKFCLQMLCFRNLAAPAATSSSILISATTR